MLYSNCLNIVQSMIAQGKLDFWVGLAAAARASRSASSFLLFRAPAVDVRAVRRRRAPAAGG